MTPRRLRFLALACLLAGLAIMIPFEGPLARVAGVGLLVAFIICGVFAIAEPGFLGDDESEAEN